MPAERTREQIVDDLSPPAAAAIGALDRLDRISRDACAAHARARVELEQHIRRLAEYMVADDQKRTRLVNDALVVATQGVE